MTTHNMSTTDNWNEIESAARQMLPPSVVEFIEQCRNRPQSSSMLIAVLHRLQGEVGYLESMQMDAVAQLMQVPAATVSGVATFYHFFQLHPPGKFHINICLGTACYVKGADKVADRFKEDLGIDYEQTTRDGNFSLQGAACLGTCGLAPVVMINQDVHAHVTPDEIPGILSRCLDSLRTPSGDHT